MAKIIVYTIRYCPYCERAKSLLKRRSVEYQEHLIPNDDDPLWDELFKRSGMRTVPQIYADDKCIGGYTDLADLDEKDQLASLRS